MDPLARHRLSLLGLDPDAVSRLSTSRRVSAVNAAFVRRVPCETLSEWRRFREFPIQPDRWTRSADRLLREAASTGLGGCCIALAHALADVLRSVGANAHVTLGRHAERDGAHGAVVVYTEDGPPRLFDPSYFVGEGIPLWPDGEAEDGIASFALRPRRGPLLCVERRAPGGRPKRLYSLIPVPAPADVVLEEWVASVRRRRDEAIRIARREDDLVKTFCEAKGCAQIHAPGGRRPIDLGHDLPAGLHEHFGVDLAVLRCHFAATAPR